MTDKKDPPPPGPETVVAGDAAPTAGTKQPGPKAASGAPTPIPEPRRPGTHSRPVPKPRPPEAVTPAAPAEPASPAFEAAAHLEQPVDPSQPAAGSMRPLGVTSGEVVPPAHVPEPVLDGPRASSRLPQPDSAQPVLAEPGASGRVLQPDGAPPVLAEPGASSRFPRPDSEPILPAAYDENVLRDAVGAPSRPPPGTRGPSRDERDDEGELPRPASRRAVAIAGGVIIGGLAIAALVFLGRANGQRYVIACTTTQVSAEQGRAFPPWGTKPLTGAEWKPITLPPNAECKPRETDDRAELEHWFLDLLIDRASTTLTTRNLLDTIQQGKTNPLDVVADQLNQALLLSRAPERRDERKEVERLLGDVQYWRASLRLRDANAALLDAAHQFETASAQRPRHVTDSAQWATFLHKLAEDLKAGPAGVAAAPTPAEAQAQSDHTPAPPGTALPVEPEGSAASEPAATPDAGLPSGGVLL